jgi:hypothetical protein
MKNLIIAALVVLGLYWLFDHYAPWPLNHESLGLFYHTAHRIVGVVCLALAVFFTWFWKFKRS